MERLKVKNKVAIALIPIIFGLIMIVDGSIMKFYTDLVGFSAGIFGRLMLIMVVFTVVNHIVSGILVDKHLHYLKIMKGIVPIAAVVAAMLIMGRPNWSEGFTAIYLMILMIIWDILKVMFHLTYAAYFFNVTSNQEDRNGIISLRQFFGLVSSFIVSIVPVIFLTGEFSIATVRTVILLIIGVGTIIALLFYRSLTEITTYTRSEETVIDFKLFWKTIIMIFKKKLFRNYFIAMFMINSVVMYYFVQYVYYMDNVVNFSGLKATIPDIAGGIMQAVVYGVIAYLTKKAGSRDVLRICVLISIASYGVLYFADGFVPVLIAYAFLMIGFAAYWVLGQSLLGLIIDVDELETGVRKAGILASISGIILIPGYNLMSMFFMALLEYSNYNGASKIQAPETVAIMRLGITAIPALILIIGIIFLSTLPLSKKREKEIEADILAVRAKQSTEEVSYEN